MCLSLCLFLTLTAAEPWPESATLYQPLKGESVFAWNGETIWIITIEVVSEGVYMTLVVFLQRIRFCCQTAPHLWLFRWRFVCSYQIYQHLYHHISLFLHAEYLSVNCFGTDWPCLVSLLYRPTSECVVYQCRWFAEPMLNTCHPLVSTHAAACHAGNLTMWYLQ